jgi:hypothetical protein
MKNSKSFAIRLAAALACALLVLLFTAACKRSGDEAIDNSTYRPDATPATEFEQKLKLVRDAHFAHVWIFERNDGRAFTPEDSQILHTNAPRVVDWVGMDDKKKFIAGSNFEIEPDKLATLKKRYKIEDYTGK